MYKEYDVDTGISDKENEECYSEETIAEIIEKVFAHLESGLGAWVERRVTRPQIFTLIAEKLPIMKAAHMSWYSGTKRLWQSSGSLKQRTKIRLYDNHAALSYLIEILLTTALENCEKPQKIAAKHSKDGIRKLNSYTDDDGIPMLTGSSHFAGALRDLRPVFLAVETWKAVWHSSAEQDVQETYPA
ncbi:hypothetical protein BWQ96_05647 [Gracilariopsis chorda]|uniref:Uncharacterized protein n=1 Tax=Gracilariopsis chorda TaxID=448386 RepID=A0A2V3ITY0_9FLOR|nr:hypothetical protein BWQ96_05647 [Gracilariopsis chorda]|eukprot:PXF44570.1 hypothetical protein BWQ96_05647 [Gracilariopsis chorda]